MLSDGVLRGLKPQAVLYKVADRDGLYVVVTPRGTISFRMDYRLNGRRETLTIGRYGTKDGISGSAHHLCRRLRAHAPAVLPRTTAL